MNIKKLVEEFVVKRAFRAGKTTRGDLAEAFSGAFSPTRISQKLTEIATSSLWVERQGKAVVPISGVEPPGFAREEDLLQCIMEGRDDFAFTGLRPQELPIQKCDWINNAPVRPGDFDRLVTALLNKQLVEIAYASLRRQDRGRLRVVAPVGLERMADQWRLIGFDIGRGDKIPRVYVLARLIEVRLLEKKIPKHLVSLGFGSEEAYRVRLNHELTAVQRQALEHELRVQDGVVRMQESHYFQFLRRYGEIPVNADSIWPIIEKMEKKS